MTKRQQFDHRQYRKLARIIHKRFCTEQDTCTYGRDTPEMREHDREILREHMNHAGSWCDCWKQLLCYNCQTSVDAENIAAKVMFGKGGKIRR